LSATAIFIFCGQFKRDCERRDPEIHTDAEDLTSDDEGPDAPVEMKHRAASRAVSRIATPKNCAASRGVFIIPRKRDKYAEADSDAPGASSASGWEDPVGRHRPGGLLTAGLLGRTYEVKGNHQSGY
jgi:hypothetical protein